MPFFGHCVQLQSWGSVVEHLADIYKGPGFYSSYEKKTQGGRGKRETNEEGRTGESILAGRILDGQDKAIENTSSGVRS